MRARFVAAAMAGALVLAACSSGATPRPAPSEGAGNPAPASTTAAVASTPQTQSVATTLAASGNAPAGEPSVAGDTKAAVAAIDPDNVLTAAVLVVSAGDVDAALASGLFSEDELTAALDAIEQGTLARYVRP
jgi:hypothetical protein